MAHTDNQTCREFIKSFRKKELEGFASYYRGRQKALPEISPKELSRDSWRKLFRDYVMELDAKG